MAANLLHLVLYSQNTFDVGDPDEQEAGVEIAAADNINTSGFGAINLGQWHVQSDGTLHYNDTPLEEVIVPLQVIVTSLTIGGGVGRGLRNAFISFGPFGTDFSNMATNWDFFTQQVSELQLRTAINGIDLDLEADYDANFDVVVKLTDWANSKGLIVTAAPYDDSKIDFWINVLKATNYGHQWWNLQLYGGATYSSWLDALNKTTVPDPQSFLVPGFAVHLGATPSNVQSALQSMLAQYPNLDGGFIWQYEDINKNDFTASQFAAAIATGLGASAQASDNRSTV